MREVLAWILDETCKLCASPIGFYHFFEKDTQSLTLQQWSTRTRKEFCTAADDPYHYPLQQAGVWADCIRDKRPVIHNDYASLPHRRGLPPGHAVVHRELVVPVLRASEVVAILGIGNKPDLYTDEDVHTVSYLADLTWSVVERKAAQEAIAASEARYRQLHESLRDAYVQTDMSGRLVECNQVYRDMLGYGDEELANLTYKDITPREWHAMEARIVEEEILPKGFSPVYEKTYCRKDGSIFPIELRTFLLRDPRGNPSGMWAIVRDITERKAAEVRLRDAESTARGTLDGLSSHIALLDSDGNILAVNQAWERFARENPPLTKSVGPGTNYFDVCEAAGGEDAPSAQAFLEGIKQVRDGRIPEYVQEYPCHSPEKKRWFVGRVTRFAGEESMRLVVAHGDITGRKFAEEALRTSEEHFRLLVECTPEAIFVQTLGRFAYVNPATVRVFGASAADDLLGQPVPERLHPEFRDSIREQIRALHEDRRAFSQVCLTFLHMDGTCFQGEVSAVPIQYAGQDGSLAFLRDVTERKHAQALIEAKTELLNLTGQLAKVGGWEFDAATGIGSWTDEVARIHGLDPADPTSMELGLSFYSETSRPLITQAVQMAIRHAVPYDLELELVSASGEHKQVRTIGKPVLDGHGKVIQVRGTFMDITELKAAQAETVRLLDVANHARERLETTVAELRRSEEEVRTLNLTLERRVEARTLELAAANQELESFAYSVSHDLRAPLRHMDGFLTILERHLGEGLDAKGAHYLDVAKKAAGRMAKLVDGLLSFSRLGRTELQQVSTDMNLLVNSVIEEFREESSSRSIAWNVGSLPSVMGDPTLLRLVFQNLLGNALKFTRHQREARIEIACQGAQGGETIFMVRDNGAGFDPAYVHKLFGVFQRLHREDEFEGTGIGLANVQRIITRHGGRVWAEGSPGAGATFYFSLPSLPEVL